ncbi:MAG: ATP-binding protein [Pseudomonadota bacterium]
MTGITQQAIAIPTKQFFVSMLTRDISLADAILDLLDNCLDGALRSANGNEVDYSIHKVSLKLSSEEFRIEDDCGGIPRDVAQNYAFKMGREPDDQRDSDTETIGMYGVGMKRAIFKMGRNALVKTQHNGDSYEVPITSDWLDSKDWDPLPINPNEDEQKQPGTIIVVNDLYQGVSSHFNNDGFINDLQTAIGEHFTSFIQKGLEITVNDNAVKPVLVEVLVSENLDDPAPYIFQKKIDGVLVSITVGLNTGRRLDSDDGENADFERNRSAATAGWTVFCNDRAVIVGDKSRLTGWGDGIPMYHGQFSVITGIVEFRSALADKLPITTTKRALDTSSNVWLEARTKMREGLRVWINHTNSWKNHPRADQSKHWENSKPLPLAKVVEIVTKRDVTNKNDGGIEYNPSKKKVLPKPDLQKPSSRKIVYSRPMEEIRLISDFLFDRDDETPGVVGDKCFEIVLEDAKEKEGET